MSLTEAEYNDQIRVLSNMPGMEKKVAELTKERDSKFGAKQSASTAGMIVLDASVDEFETSNSKFANKGLHVSEFGTPLWHTPGVSLDFPFTIIEGPNKGLEGAISAGVSKAACWKIKEILTAVGAAYTSTKDGRVAFNPDDVAGKKALVQWDEFKDDRSPEEGGKGTVYTKPTKALKIE